MDYLIRGMIMVKARRHQYDVVLGVFSLKRGGIVVLPVEREERQAKFQSKKKNMATATFSQAYHHQHHQPTTVEEVRTLWIGDLQYWVDENYLSTCFAHTGEVFLFFLQVYSEFMCGFGIYSEFMCDFRIYGKELEILYFC